MHGQKNIKLVRRTCRNYMTFSWGEKKIWIMTWWIVAPCISEDSYPGRWRQENPPKQPKNYAVSEPTLIISKSVLGYLLWNIGRSLLDSTHTVLPTRNTIMSVAEVLWRSMFSMLPLVPLDFCATPYIHWLNCTILAVKRA